MLLTLPHTYSVPYWGSDTLDGWCSLLEQALIETGIDNIEIDHPQEWSAMDRSPFSERERNTVQKHPLDGKYGKPNPASVFSFSQGLVGGLDQ